MAFDGSVYFFFRWFIVGEATTALCKKPPWVHSSQHLSKCLLLPNVFKNTARIAKMPYGVPKMGGGEGGLYFFKLYFPSCIIPKYFPKCHLLSFASLCKRPLGFKAWIFGKDYVPYIPDIFHFFPHTQFWTKFSPLKSA